MRSLNEKRNQLLLNFVLKMIHTLLDRDWWSNAIELRVRILLSIMYLFSISENVDARYHGLGNLSERSVHCQLGQGMRSEAKSNRESRRRIFLTGFTCTVVNSLWQTLLCSTILEQKGVDENMYSFARVYVIGIRRGEETASGGIEKSFVCFKLEIIHEPKRSIGICDNDVELKKVVQKAPFFFLA